MQKIYYLSPRDVRKNRSDAVHIMKTCDGFTKNDFDVTLITPKVKRIEYKKKFNEIYKLYGINSKFNIYEMPIAYKENLKKFKYDTFVGLIKFLNSFYFFLKNSNLFNDNTIIYSKCFISTVPVLLLKKIGLINSSIVFETISPKHKLLHKFIFRYSNKIISHTKFSTENIVKYSKCSNTKIFEPTIPLQSESFDKIITKRKEYYKEELKLPNDKPLIMYAGKTGEGVKEVDYFIEVAKLKYNYNFIIVGANEKSQKDYNDKKKQDQIYNLIIIPFQTLSNYYKFVKSADVLVGYYPATYHNKYHLSPGKAGAYLSSKNPIIFSDIPSLRYLFPEDILFFAEPDKYEKLADMIEYVLTNESEAKEKANNAFNFAMLNNYKKFTKEIIDFITIN